LEKRRESIFDTITLIFYYSCALKYYKGGKGKQPKGNLAGVAGQSGSVFPRTGFLFCIWHIEIHDPQIEIRITNQG
jgi:hypothetical protein